MTAKATLRNLASAITVALLSSASISLPSSAAPSSPTNVSVTSTSEPNTALASASARVEWAASSGAVGYSILATAGDQNVFGSTPVCQNGNCVAFLSGLTGGTSYGVRVSAVAADGSSANSTAVNHTAVSVPSGPSGLIATPANGAVRLQWTEPGSLGGLALSGYVLVDQENRETSLASGVVSYTVSNLVNGTSYTFRLAAVNQNGRSVEARFSATTPVGPPASPARPTVSTTSNTLTATWTAPGDGGSPITGYRAVLFREGTRETEQVLGAGVLTATFNNLTAANFTVRIQAVNAIGASELSVASLPTQVGQVQQAQTISFGAISTQTPPGALNLSATASSGLTVTFTATGVCSIELGSTIVSFQSVGTCTVVASQAGNAAFQAAPSVTQSFQVSNTVVQPGNPSLGGGGGGGGRAPAPSSGGGGSGTADIFISESPTVSYRVAGEVHLTISGSALSTVYRVTLGGVTASFEARTDNTLNLKFVAPPTGSSQLIVFFGDRARSLTIEIIESSGATPSPSNSPVITIPRPTESPEPVVVSPRPKAPSASVGSFKGFLAIYLSQLEGQRVSLRIAGKWQTVRSVPSNFFRLTRKVGAGFRVNVQVFVAGKALKTITVRTK